MKINKSKLKVGYVFEGSEGEEVITYIDRDNGEVYCRFVEEEGNRYNLNSDGSIEV